MNKSIVELASMALSCNYRNGMPKEWGIVRNDAKIGDETLVIRIIINNENMSDVYILEGRTFTKSYGAYPVPEETVIFRKTFPTELYKDMLPFMWYSFFNHLKEVLEELGFGTDPLRTSGWEWEEATSRHLRVMAELCQKANVCDNAPDWDRIVEGEDDV